MAKINKYSFKPRGGGFYEAYASTKTVERKYGIQTDNYGVIKKWLSDYGRVEDVVKIVLEVTAKNNFTIIFVRDGGEWEISREEDHVE